MPREPVIASPAMGPFEGEPRGVRRLNFFKGLVTYHTDWSDRESYRRDKQRWHNLRCHGAGVVAGEAGELAVSGRGDLSVEIQPGCALDATGNELVLRETQVKQVPIEGLELPQTLFVLARFTEAPTDFIAYKHDPRLRGHRRVVEGCQIEIAPRAASSGELELARMRLEPGVRAVSDAKIAARPQANEIDRRYVAWVGRAGSGFQQTEQLAITTLLQETRRTLGMWARAGRVRSAADALHQTIAMSALHLAALTDPRSLFELFGVLFELQVAIYVELKTTRLAQGTAWEAWVEQLRLMDAALAESPPRIDRLLEGQRRLNGHVQAMFAGAPTRAG